MPLRLFAFAAGCALLWLALGGCSSVPPLCVQPVRWEDAATRTLAVGARMPMRAGLLDILEECDRPAPAGVAWSSSNPAVAAADGSGMVHALAPGTADVVARAAGAEARYRVTVVPAVARIEITPAETTLTAGDTARFRVTAYGVDGALLPAVPLALRATEARASYPGPPAVPALVGLAPHGPAGGATSSGINELRVYAKRRAWGHVVASLVGRRLSRCTRDRAASSSRACALTSR